MPVSVRVSTLRSDQLRKLASGLRVLSAGDFFRRVQLNEQMDDALSYLKGLSQSLSYNSGRRDYRRGLGISDALLDMPLSETWRIQRVTEGNRVFFKLHSLLETQGGKRGLAKLLAIEEGNKETSVQVRKTFTFLGTQGFRTFVKGRFIRRPRREGKHLVFKTSEYIKAVLFPQVRALVNLRVRKILQP